MRVSPIHLSIQCLLYTPECTVSPIHLNVDLQCLLYTWVWACSVSYTSECDCLLYTWVRVKLASKTPFFSSSAWLRDLGKRKAASVRQRQLQSPVLNPSVLALQWRSLAQRWTLGESVDPAIPENTLTCAPWFAQQPNSVILEKRQIKGKRSCIIERTEPECICVRRHGLCRRILYYFAP